jgi:hypothetical protein
MRFLTTPACTAVSAGVFGMTGAFAIERGQRERCAPRTALFAPPHKKKIVIPNEA